MKSQIQSLIYFAVVLVIFGVWSSTALGNQQQQPFSFQVKKGDVAKAEKLADELASLSSRVNREEAKLLSECAYATVSKLRREYRMFGTPIFNNFLIYHGIRKRGYCYHGRRIYSSQSMRCDLKVSNCTGANTIRAHGARTIASL